MSSTAAQATAQTLSLVERAREEVNIMKEALAAEAPGADDATIRANMKKLHAAEALLQKAESSVRRVKVASGTTPRPPTTSTAAERAARALAVLSGGGPPERLFVPLSSGRSRPLLSEADLSPLCARATAAAQLGVGTLGQAPGVGVGFFCEGVFRAFLWFRPARASPGHLTPEHIAVFGVDETGATRWSASKHAVFGVLTERANAAVRYFWAREARAEDALIALAKWLAMHKTMFADKCEDRRLAFDASRGYFLPACVRSFDGVGGPRFTRGSIPVRGSSSAPYSRGQAAASGSQAAAAAAAASSATHTAANANNGSRRS